MDFAVKFDLENAIKTLKDWWCSDLDIEIDTWRDKNVLIFGLDNNSYWSNGEWYFSGKRVLFKPMDDYMTKKFKEFMEDREYFGEEFTLEEAIEFVKDFYNKDL